MGKAECVLYRLWRMWIVSLGEGLRYRMVGLGKGSRLSIYIESSRLFWEQRESTHKTKPLFTVLV